MDLLGPSGSHALGIAGNGLVETEGARTPDTDPATWHGPTGS